MRCDDGVERIAVFNRERRPLEPVDPTRPDLSNENNDLRWFDSIEDYYHDQDKRREEEKERDRIRKEEKNQKRLEVKRIERLGLKIGTDEKTEIKK